MDWAISDSLSWFPTAGSPLHTVWGMGNWRQKGKEASLRSEASLALSARPSFPPGRTPAGVRAGAFSFSGAADSRTWTRTARFTPANGAGGSKPSPTAGVIAATVGAKPARQRTGNVPLPCPRRYAAVPRSWACRVRMPIAGCRRLGWGIHKRDPSRCSPAASPQARHTFLCLAHSSTTGLLRLARLAGEEERVSAFLDVIMQMHPRMRALCRQERRRCIGSLKSCAADFHEAPRTCMHAVPSLRGVQGASCQAVVSVGAV